MRIVRRIEGLAAQATREYAEGFDDRPTENLSSLRKMGWLRHEERQQMLRIVQELDSS